MTMAVFLLSLPAAFAQEAFSGNWATDPPPPRLVRLDGCGHTRAFVHDLHNAAPRNIQFASTAAGRCGEPRQACGNGQCESTKRFAA